MNRILLARKGEASPATSHYGGESRFQERRVIELPAIALGGETRLWLRPAQEGYSRRDTSLIRTSPAPRPAQGLLFSAVR